MLKEKGYLGMRAFVGASRQMKEFMNMKQYNLNFVQRKLKTDKQNVRVSL